MSKDKSNDQVLEEKTLEEAFTELEGQRNLTGGFFPVLQTGDGAFEIL